MYGYLKNVSPGLSPNKDTKDEYRLCRSSAIRQPGQKMISDMKLGFPFVSPYIRKPHVRCCGTLVVIKKNFRFLLPNRPDSYRVTEDHG
jgi:hypothetical protein